jgi:hypothetical protein
MHPIKNFRNAYDNRFDPKMAHTMTDFAWYGSVRAAAVLLVATLAFGGWLLYDARYASGSGNAAPTPIDTISRTQLSAVLDMIQARSVRYDSVKKSPSAVVDLGK